jgi:hypothetical protein
MKNAYSKSRYLLLLMLLLISCTGKLSREDALKIVKLYKHTPIILKEKVPKLYGIEAGHSPLTNDEQNTLQLLTTLQNAGLITFVESLSQGILSYRIFNVTLTNKGLPFLISSDQQYYYVKIGESDVTAINGISEADQSSGHVTVQYELSCISTTAFYSYLEAGKAGFNYTGNNIDLVKYDDGWRVADGTDKGAY